MVKIVSSYMQRDFLLNQLVLIASCTATVCSFGKGISIFFYIIFSHFGSGILRLLLLSKSVFLLKRRKQPTLWHVSDFPLRSLASLILFSKQNKTNKQKSNPEKQNHFAAYGAYFCQLLSFPKARRLICKTGKSVFKFLSVSRVLTWDFSTEVSQ